MMAAKNLYISDRDRPTWDAAESLAAEKGISLGALVTLSLDHLMRTATVEAAIIRPVLEAIPKDGQQ